MVEEDIRLKQGLSNQCVTTVVCPNPLNSPIRRVAEVLSVPRVLMQVNSVGPCELSYTATSSPDLLLLPLNRGDLTFQVKSTPSSTEEQFRHTSQYPSPSVEKTTSVVGLGRCSAGV